MNTAFNLPVLVVENEPRILDTDLAAALGMSRPRDIRGNLIGPNRPELERHGILREMNANSGKRGRPVTAFYLNEQQALLITLFSRTEKAEDIRELVINVFMAWRRGQMDLNERGKAELPNFADPVAAARAWADVFEQKAALRQLRTFQT